MKHLRRTFLRALVPGSVLSVLGLKATPSQDQQMHDKLQQLLDFRDEKRTRLASNFLDILVDIAEQKLKQKGGSS